MTYAGPETDHLGKEICIDSNADQIAIVDVSTKSSPLTLATFTYPNLEFVHQNWLTEDLSTDTLIEEAFFDTRQEDNNNSGDTILI